LRFFPEEAAVVAAHFRRREAAGGIVTRTGRDAEAIEAGGSVARPTGAR
jgi:hypothetical protein